MMIDKVLSNHWSFIFVEQTGIEPVPSVFQTNVQTCYTTLPYYN